MKNHVVVEQGPTSFGAYVPDLPGCCAVAADRDEVLKLIQEAIALHLEDMTQQGVVVPTPLATGKWIDVTP